MGAKFQIINRFQRDLLLLQYFAGRAQHEVGMRGEEGLHDVLIFFRQEAARRVHQSSAFFQQAAGGGEDGGLLMGVFFDAAGRLAEFQIRAAPQRAKPLHGASTSTRSILPARRLTLRSFSCAISIGWILLAPERFRRGLRLARRFSETSIAYKRPCEFIIADSISVLPPAPAQKSTTMSLRLGASRKPSNWLPSSCTSILPSVNSASRLSGIFSLRRIPMGE